MTSASPLPNSTPRPSVEADWVHCYNENHRYALEQAIAACTDIIEADNAGSRMYAAGALWYRAKHYEAQDQDDLANADLHSAIEIYANRIRTSPRDSAAFNNRGSVNARLENYGAALEDYDRAIALNNDYSAPHQGRAMVLFRRGDYGGAMESYDRASQIEARLQGASASAYAGKCSSRAAARVELGAARRFCDRAVRNSRNAAWALAVRGYFRVMQGDLDGAAQDFARAVERDEYNAPALYGRGAVAVRQGRMAEGEADMARAMDMDRRSVEYYANAGLRP